MVGPRRGRGRRVQVDRRRCHRHRALHQLVVHRRQHDPRPRQARVARLHGQGRQADAGGGHVHAQAGRDARQRSGPGRGAHAVAHPRQPLLHQRRWTAARRRAHQRRRHLQQAAREAAAGPDDPRLDHASAVRPVLGARGHRWRADQARSGAGLRHGPRQRQRRPLALSAVVGFICHPSPNVVGQLDTKFELGIIDGCLSLCDEVMTPDSSRFWPADEWTPGSTPPSFDKQPLRDHLETLDWDKTPPPPVLPAEVIDASRERYVTAYERITSLRFADWPGVSGA
ncbi:MAG: hypothetical protein HYX34_04185 [Actinobacteria bacterium]|nr:hypothetical protein [Actinomycetota bacterium]